MNTEIKTPLDKIITIKVNVFWQQYDYSQFTVMDPPHSLLINKETEMDLD
jgi:hypothetical protein